MGYYSDPTANMALGSINREFSRLEKKAKKLRKAREDGKISEEKFSREAAVFKGLYRHVLELELERKKEEEEPA